MIFKLWTLATCYLPCFVFSVNLILTFLPHLIGLNLHFSIPYSTGVDLIFLTTPPSIGLNLGLIFLSDSFNFGNIVLEKTLN